MKYCSLVMAAWIFLTCSACQSQSESNTQQTDTLVVLTYNIHHGNAPGNAPSKITLDSIAAVINKVNPDLVALQEIDVHTNRSGSKLDEAKRLAELTEMKSHFTKTFDYDGGAYGIAVLSRLPILKKTNYLLPKIDSSGEEIRAVSLIKVQYKDSIQLNFASTHLGLSQKTRLMQVDSISKIAATVSSPFIICGDFNATPDSEAIQKITTVFHRSCTTDCDLTFPFDAPREKIDYIFYKGKNRLQPIDQYAISGTKWSDHLPVVTKFLIQ